MFAACRSRRPPSRRNAATADGGGAIDFHGLDPLVPSTIRLGGGAALGLVQQSVVAAALHRDRGGPGQDIAIQLSQALRKLAPGFERRWELLNGHMAVLEDPNIMTMLRFYRTADDREVLAANLYPKLKSGMMALLQWRRCSNAARPSEYSTSNVRP